MQQYVGKYVYKFFVFALKLSLTNCVLMLNIYCLAFSQILAAFPVAAGIFFYIQVRVLVPQVLFE